MRIIIQNAGRYSDSFEYDVTDDKVFFYDDKGNEVDNRLIAAAPDLLTIVEKVYSAIHPHGFLGGNGFGAAHREALEKQCAEVLARATKGE